MSNCLQCSKPIVSKWGSKFCCRSHAALYNNSIRSLESRNKQRSTIRKKYSSDLKVHKTKIQMRKEAYLENPQLCNVCSTAIDFSNRRRKTCSDKCLDIRNKQNCSKRGRNSASKNVKRSKQEIELFERCKEQFPDALSNHVIAEGWDADIVLPESKVAILWNGPWHYQQMPFQNHSLKQVQTRDRLKTKLFESLGWKVLIFEDRHFTPMSAYNTLVGLPGTDPSSIPYEGTASP